MSFATSLLLYASKVLARSCAILDKSSTHQGFIARITALVNKALGNNVACLRLFGSVGSGISLVTSDSDIDLALLFPDSDNLKGSRQQGLHALNKIAEELRGCGMKKVVVTSAARVAVVSFKDSSTGISCDISAGHRAELGVAKAELLQRMGLATWLYPTLTILAKHWMVRRGLKNPQSGKLNSFTIALCVGHFLHRRGIMQTSKSWLTQASQQTSRAPLATIDDGGVARATKTRVDAALANNDEALRVAELLRDFFRYMSLEFGYIIPDSYSDGKFAPSQTPAKFLGRTRCNREVISINGARLTLRTSVMARHDTPKTFCVQDPIQPSENTARTLSGQFLQNWRAELHRAFLLISTALSGSVVQCGEAADAVRGVMEVDASAQWEKVVCCVPNQKRKKEDSPFLLPEVVTIPSTIQSRQRLPVCPLLAGVELSRRSQHKLREWAKVARRDSHDEDACVHGTHVYIHPGVYGSHSALAAAVAASSTSHVAASSYANIVASSRANIAASSCDESTTISGILRVGKSFQLRVLDSEILRHEEPDHEAKNRNAMPVRWWRYVRVELRALESLPTDGDGGGGVDGDDNVPPLPATRPEDNENAIGVDSDHAAATCGGGGGGCHSDAEIAAARYMSTVIPNSNDDGTTNILNHKKTTFDIGRASQPKGKGESLLGYVVLECSMNALPLLPLDTSIPPIQVPKESKAVVLEGTATLAVCAAQLVITENTCQPMATAREAAKARAEWEVSRRAMLRAERFLLLARPLQSIHIENLSTGSQRRSLHHYAELHGISSRSQSSAGQSTRGVTLIKPRTYVPLVSDTFAQVVKKLGLATTDMQPSSSVRTDTSSDDYDHHKGSNTRKTSDSGIISKEESARGQWRWRRGWLNNSSLLQHMDVYPLHITSPQASITAPKGDTVHLRTLDFLNNFQLDGASGSESGVKKDFEQIGSHAVNTDVDIDIDIDASDVDAVNAACEAIARRTSKGRKVTLFSGKEDYRSRWFRVGFEIAGQQYVCIHQYMIAEKARLFRDQDTARRITNQKTYDGDTAHLPNEQDRHTNTYHNLKGFDDSAWSTHARSIAYRGTLAKFTQNPKIRDKLLATGASVLAEASKTDRRWGIGLGHKDTRAFQPSRWKGSNWLGQVLMLVRATLRSDHRSPLNVGTKHQSKRESTTKPHPPLSKGSKNKLKANMLRSCPALAALINKFRLKFNVHPKLPNLVQLHYSQMESQMSSAVVQECRGIILARQQIHQEQHQQHVKAKSRTTKRKNNREQTVNSKRWKYSVVAMPFYKFFNFGEQHSKIRRFDWSTAQVHEKLDGSMMLMYYFAGAWRVASSNLPDAGGRLQDMISSSSVSIPTHLTTAADLFWWCYKDRCGWDLPPPRSQHICFVFEMMTELNTVVVRNKYQPHPLVCIGLRDCNTLHELPASTDTLHSLGCGHMLTPREFDLLPKTRSDPEACLQAVVEAARKLNPMQQEGFVVVDGGWRRMKVKSSKYVAIHLMLNNKSKAISDLESENTDRAHLRERRVVQAVLTNDHDEFLSYFPTLVPLVATTRFRLDVLCNRIADLALKKSDLQLPAHEAFADKLSKFDKRLLVRGFTQRFKDAYIACFSEPKNKTESTAHTSKYNDGYTPGCPSGLREVILAALSSLDTRVVAKILNDHIAQPQDLSLVERTRLHDCIDRLRKTYPVTEGQESPREERSEPKRDDAKSILMRIMQTTPTRPALIIVAAGATVSPEQAFSTATSFSQTLRRSLQKHDSLPARAQLCLVHCFTKSRSPATQGVVRSLTSSRSALLNLVPKPKKGKKRCVQSIDDMVDFAAIASAVQNASAAVVLVSIGDVDLISLSSAAPKADLTLQLRLKKEERKTTRNGHKERVVLATESAATVSTTTLVDYLTESLIKS